VEIENKVRDELGVPLLPVDGPAEAPATKGKKVKAVEVDVAG
jgi:recombination protein RecA